MKYKFRSYLPLPADGENVDGGAGDTTALRSALDKERKAREAAEKKVKEMTDAQELSNKSLADHVAQLQQQMSQMQSQHESEKSQLQGQISQRDIRSAFASAFAESKGLPEYSDVLYSHLGGQLPITDGKITTTDGKPLSEAIAAARSRLPAFFAPMHDGAGSGAAPNNGGSSSSSVRVIRGDDVAATQSIDPADLASGKVVIE